MQFTNSLINSVIRDYPNLKFKQDTIFRWSPNEMTVYFTAIASKEDKYTLLHELAHACLQHRTFTDDAELLRKELEAWEYASLNLSDQYDVTIPSAFIESSLDSYRIWLHQRSLCPKCAQNGIQTKNDTYECINCRCRWRVNDARQCQLKRYRLVTGR